MSKHHKLLYTALMIWSCLLFTPVMAKSTPLVLDSIRVENIEGKQVIIHVIEAKETYYSLGRRYAISPKTIMAYNENQALKINDLIRIPTGLPFIETPEPTLPVTTQGLSAPPSTSENVIKYKVGKGETLYSVSKRFNVSEARIMEFNQMTDKSLQVDQELLIPKGPPPRREPLVVASDNEEEERQEEEAIPQIEQNRYGIRQMNEKGIGVWLEGLNADGGKMLALHKTAPVGTVIKITNPMTKRSTFAKVVGKYTDSNLTRDAIVIISKAAANQIGILDKRFLVHISYGVPER